VDLLNKQIEPSVGSHTNTIAYVLVKCCYTLIMGSSLCHYSIDSTSVMH